MSVTAKRLLIVLIIAVVAFVLGRVGMRLFMNLMLGGTMFGGDFL